MTINTVPTSAPSQMDPPKIKVLLAGDVGVGKSSFAARLTSMLPNDPTFTVPTIGCEYSQLVRPHDVVQIWDLSGNPKYDSFFSLYVAQTKHILLFYDVGSIRSFERMIKIYSLNIAPLGTDDAQLVVVANKCDHNIDPYAHVPKTSLDAFLSDVHKKFPRTTNHFLSAIEDDRSALLRVLPPSPETMVSIDDNETSPVPGNIICAASRCSLF